MKTKTKIKFVMLLGASLMLSSQFVKAQVDWHVAGNAGITSTQFFGTTDTMPIKFKTNNHEYMRIRGEGTTADAGKFGYVGIGTTAPTSKLHVVGTSRLQGATAIVGATTITGNATVSALTTTATFKMTGGTPGLNKILRSDAAGLSSWITNPVGTNTTNYVPKWNGTQLVKGIIFDNGTGVGIGTTTPLYKIDVQGSYPFIRVLASSGYAGIVLDKSDALYNNYVIYRTAGSDRWTTGTMGNDNFNLHNWSLGTDALTVDINNNNANFSGRIGVKTTPSYDLDINSADYTAGYVTSPYNGGTVFEVVAAGTTSGTWGLFAYATTAGYAAYFSGNVYCSGSYLPSDERLKENIQPLQNALDKVMKLDIKTYNFKSGLDEMNLPAEKQYGFIAQNLETVFPELVKLNPAKKEQPVEFKAVNYIGMIPILTESVQEQQKQIEELKTTVKDLENALASCCSNYSAARNDANNLSVSDKPSLEQNAPNPFSSETSIHYYLPSNSTAVLKVMSLEGQEMLTTTISKTGYGEVRISGSTMAAGTYTYTLIVNGKTVESKIMVLTK